MVMGLFVLKPACRTLEGGGTIILLFSGRGQRIDAFVS